MTGCWKLNTIYVRYLKIKFERKLNVKFDSYD